MQEMAAHAGHNIAFVKLRVFNALQKRPGKAPGLKGFA